MDMDPRTRGTQFSIVSAASPARLMSERAKPNGEISPRLNARYTDSPTAMASPDQ